MNCCRCNTSECVKIVEDVENNQVYFICEDCSQYITENCVCDETLSENCPVHGDKKEAIKGL